MTIPSSSFERGPVVLTEAGLRLHQNCLVVDGHNDLLGRIREEAAGSFDRLDIAQRQPALHTDIPRLRAGGVGAQFWAAYLPSRFAEGQTPAGHVHAQIALLQEMTRRYPQHFELARSTADIERIHQAGRIASLAAVEGGKAIENNLDHLRSFYAAGARYMTLTHADTTDWCDSATDAPRHGGLSEFGREVVREMNRLGMLVDISHISVDAARDVLHTSEAPIIASHSGADRVAAHPRNIPDDVLTEIAAADGLVMVNFYSGFIVPAGAIAAQSIFEVARRIHAEYADNPAGYQTAKEQWIRQTPIPRGDIHALLDHIDHIAAVAGVRHVGIGSDFDGISTVPAQLDDAACYPYITQGLLDRGYSEEAIRGIMGTNLLRVMRSAENQAHRSEV